MTTTIPSPLHSPVLDSVVKAIEHPSQTSPSNNLRVLIVDDNHINLSVLSTLLKRRFSHILAGAPVTVDSGLKAIQLLRSEVFDVCLLDIQMPYLDGVECTRRIRSSSDGVLAANAGMHIVAVTTAVGDDPAEAYRAAGMDGLIAKPVRQHDLQEYLYPLAFEALVAERSDRVGRIIVSSGQSVMPPMPPTATGAPRAFYLPQASTQALRDRPEICDNGEFASRLKAQTRASLKIAGAMAKARSSTLSARTAKNGQRSNSDTSAHSASRPAVTRAPQPPHSRGDSVNINAAMLHRQLQTEIANSPIDSDGGDAGTVSDSNGAAATVRGRSNRPRPHHRLSSPAWLRNDWAGANAEGSCITDDETDGRRMSGSRPGGRLWAKALRVPLRPALSTATSVFSSSDPSDTDDLPSRQTPALSASGGGDMATLDSLLSSSIRRDSEMTTASGDSAVSDATSVETPDVFEGDDVDAVRVHDGGSSKPRWDGGDSALPPAQAARSAGPFRADVDYFNLKPAGKVNVANLSRCPTTSASSDDQALSSLFRVASLEDSEATGGRTSV